MTDIIKDKQIKKISASEILDKISASKKMLIISHSAPDGDTLGSAAALAYLAERIGTEVTCAVPDEIPHRLEFTAYTRTVSSKEAEASAKNGEFDLICSVDVASPSQLSSLACLIPYIDFMIDHHSSGEPYTDYLIDSSASAAGEIIFSLYRSAEERGLTGRDARIARGIYTAVVSDTGSFKYSNVTPETHTIAASLVNEINSADDGGATTEELCRSLFGKRTMRDLQAQALAIKNLKVYEDGKIGVVLLSTEDMALAGLESRDLGAAVETPRSLEGVMIALSIKQNRDAPTTFKISSRSNYNADVSAVCARFGGGGHVKAAGCSITADSPDEAVNIAVSAFAEAIPKE